MQHHARFRKHQIATFQAYTRSMMATIGTITISWACIELFLAHLIVWHTKQAGVVPKGGMPRMLDAQLKHLKKIIEGDPIFTLETAALLRKFRLEIDRLNDFRKNIIHGVVHQRNRFSTDWHTQSVKFEGDGWSVINHSYSNDEFQRFADDISALSGRMSPGIALIIGLPHPANSA
jgi:hypothetical protein